MRLPASCRWTLACAALVACARRAAPPAAPPPAVAAAPEVAESSAPATPLVRVPDLTYRTLFPGKEEPPQVAVRAFLIEAHTVTNAQFLDFVRAQPAWRRSAVAPLFAEAGYLRHWRDDLALADGDAERPVVNVSWFAARAYAAWRGRRLPTLAEWEAVAAVGLRDLDAAGDPDTEKRILDWYARPATASPQPVRSTPRNALGVYDLHGLVWEWVEDFNSAMVTGESRGDSALERSMFCGSGALGAANPRDYAAFMRQAFRSGLGAHYVIGRLGFRCAAEVGS